MTRLLLQCLAIAAVTAAVVFLLGRFAVSDFLHHDKTVWDEKPWRPVSRLIFGTVAIPIVLAFMGLFTRSLFRKPRP
jgi:hypothetical protein